MKRNADRIGQCDGEQDRTRRCYHYQPSGHDVGIDEAAAECNHSCDRKAVDVHPSRQRQMIGFGVGRLVWRRLLNRHFDRRHEVVTLLIRQVSRRCCA